MKIQIYLIAKPEEDAYTMIVESFIKRSASFAKISMQEVFSKEITQAQKISEEKSKQAYEAALKPHLGPYNIALDPAGESLDSHGFSKIIQDRSDIRFFIGGAYGHGRAFLESCQKRVSLSPLTFSHKLALAVLSEQIYRSLSIINHHPYHKE